MNRDNRNAFAARGDNMKPLAALAITAALLTHVGHVSAEDEEPLKLMQVFLGSLQLDDQSGRWTNGFDEPVDLEFPDSLPSGGMEGEYVYGEGYIHWGVNPGGSIAWKNSGTKISGGFTGDTGAIIRVDLDNSLFLGELHLGGFVRARLGPRFTAYAAAGPMIMYGSHEVEDGKIPEVSPSNNTVVIETSDESDFGFGAYARAGIDYRLKDQQRLGFGIRYMYAELDFNNTVGKVDIEGPQYVLAYTMPF
ncbi:MAG: hypothetical protein ABJ013_12710 [Halioglobus sp.]